MSEELGPRITVRGFAAGGRVRETGLAVVHEGELIVPAEGCEAVIDASGAGTAEVINFYFPVEIVVMGTLPPEEREAIEARVWQRLGDAIERVV